MPNKRSTAAQHAGEAQRATGEKYTAALRRPSSPDQVLHAAVRVAGLGSETARLDDVAAFQRQIAPLIARADALDKEVWDGEDRLPHSELAAFQGESNAIWDRLMVMRGDDVYWKEWQVLYAAHGALVRAGTVLDRHARRPVSAAAGVMAEGPGSLATADAVRCPGHYASAQDGFRHRPGTCGPLIAPPRGSAKTVLARAACEAAALLGEAARVPWSGDEEWTHCADLLDQAFAAARDGLAASRRA